MSATVQSGTSRRRFPRLLSLFASFLIMAMFAQGAAAAPARQAAPTLDKILQVQPIIVSNDDGTETARSFGGGPGDASYEYIIGVTKRALAQAGIHVIFLPAKGWNNTLANFGDPCQYDGHTGTGAPGDPCTGGNRPHDADAVIQAAEAAGVASVGQHSSILDAYFLRVDPGWPNWGNFTGAGTQLNNSFIMAIGDDGWLANQDGWDNVGLTLAHEIGHNLGLLHTENDPTFTEPCPAFNLMTSGDCQAIGVPWGIDLTASQIAIARQGDPRWAVPIPVPALPVARKMVDNTLLAVANLSLRKDVKATLRLTLDAVKLALRKNNPGQACKAMKLYDSSVTFFLGKGKLTASQGRLLNTASKDIRAPIGCQ